LAASNGHVEATKVLIAAGADKNALDYVSIIIIIYVYNLYIAVHRYYIPT